MNRAPLLMTGLLLVALGVAALLLSARTGWRGAFETDARILVRVLSQRMEQQEAVLRAVDALDRQQVSAATLEPFLGTLRQSYPQVVAVERCDGEVCQVLSPPAEVLPPLRTPRSAQPALHWPTGNGPRYVLTLGRVRVWIDARKLLGNLDQGAQTLGFRLLRPGTGAVIVSQPQLFTARPATTLTLSKHLGTALQPFPLEAQRAVPWTALPFAPVLAWLVLTGALMVLISRLLTGRRAAQQAVLDERARAQGVVQAASEAIVALDGQDRVTLANPAAQRLLGQVIVPGIPLRPALTLQATLAQVPFDATGFWGSPGPISLPEGLALVRGGEAVLIEGSLAPLRTAAGVLEGRVLILREVGTLQRRLLGQLEDGERRVREHAATLAHVTRLATLGEMSAGLAHELNQPLTAIVSYGQAARRLLVEPDPDLTQVSRTVDSAVKQARRAADIIVRLRNLVRRAPAQTRQTDLAQSLQSVLILCRPEMERQGAEVNVTLPPAPLVQVDPVQLEQIVLNLLRNALDAVEGQPTPQLHIEVKAEGPAWSLFIRDNGPGLSPEVQARLFVPFTTTKPGGLGLGLSLSQTLAQGMGGELHGANRGDGAGAVFTLTLPMAAVPPTRFEAASD